MESRCFVPEEELGDFTAVNSRIYAINSLQVANLLENKKCASCDSQPDETLLSCTGCSAVYFCNQKCQKEHWKRHKLECPRHDKIGLKGIRFIPSRIGLVSLSDNPLFVNATQIVANDDGLPCAIWKGKPGKAFADILKDGCGRNLVVDSSLYAQIVILAQNWTNELFQFCLFTGTSPAWSQLHVFGLEGADVPVLLPKDEKVLAIFSHTQESSTLDHYQGPRQIELVRDTSKDGFYRGLLRHRGAVRYNMATWGDQATIDLAIWANNMLEYETPMSFGTKVTWELNKRFAKDILDFCENSKSWTLKLCKERLDFSQ